MTLRSEAIAYIREELVRPDPLTDALQQQPLEAGHVTTYLPEHATDEEVRNLRACGLYQCLLQWTKPTNCSPLTGTLTELARTKAELLAENALLRQQLIMLHHQVETINLCEDRPAVGAFVLLVLLPLAAPSLDLRAVA